MQLIGEIGSQAVDIANTYGETEGLKAARDELAKEGVTEPGADASDSLKKAYQDALRGTDAYKTTTAKYGTGSDLQRGIQAVTAALQGLAGSDLTAALAGASAPELANYIGHGSGLSDEAAVVAHAILGGAVAALQGNSAAAGAAGAATGELAAKAIAGMLYPDVKDLSTLSEEQKQTVSALATISAGMAGGLAGDSAGSAVAGGQAGKNAAENNSLSKNKPPVNIFDINQLKPNALDADGDPLKGGGGNSGSAYNPTGRSGNPMNTKGSNSPAVIGERTYSAHAVDRMQGRGVPPSAVENTIKAGVTYPTNSGTTGYYDSTNNLRVIINSKTGDVVTVIPGAPTK